MPRHVACVVRLARLIIRPTTRAYGVSAKDPLTFTGIAGTLLPIVSLAWWIPARGASRVGPMIALRAE